MPCCTCFLRAPIPALVSLLCLTPLVALIPVFSSSPALSFSLAGGPYASACLASHMAVLCILHLRRYWRRGVSNHPYRPLAIHLWALDVRSVSSVKGKVYESRRSTLNCRSHFRAVSRKMLRGNSDGLLRVMSAPDKLITAVVGSDVPWQREGLV